MNPNKESADIIRHAMQNAKGDNLERAEASFRHVSTTSMDQEYGQSGKTRRDILEEYRANRRKWEAANKYLETLLT